MTTLELHYRFELEMNLLMTPFLFIFFLLLKKDKADGKEVVRFSLRCSNHEKHEIPQEREQVCMSVKFILLKVFNNRRYWDVALMPNRLVDWKRVHWGSEWEFP